LVHEGRAMIGKGKVVVIPEKAKELIDCAKEIVGNVVALLPEEKRPKPYLTEKFLHEINLEDAVPAGLRVEAEFRKS
jgi:hypothetical protein